MYSDAVGAWDNAMPALCPERSAQREAGRQDNIEILLLWVSETEDAQYCQPCGHSPGSRVVLWRSRRKIPPNWVATRSPCVPTRLPLQFLETPIKGHSSLNMRTTAMATSGVRWWIIWMESAHHNAQLTAIPDRPFAWATSPTHEPLPHTRPGPLPRTLWRWTRCLRSWATQQAADKLGGIVLIVWSPKGWRSATVPAKHTGDLVQNEWLPTEFVPWNFSLPSSQRCKTHFQLESPTQ